MFTIPLTPDNPSLKTKLSVPAHAVLHNKKGEPNAHLLNEYFSINRTSRFSMGFAGTSDSNDEIP